MVTMTTGTQSMSYRRYLENFKHHVYAAYSEKNAREVRLVLDHLRRAGLKVYDPAFERQPGKSIFHKWLQNGIHKSKITLLFWSKEFKQDVLCAYQSENAMMRNILSKGRHIVICVVIDNCKIPKLYEKFDCIYAWKWKTNPPEALENIWKSLIARLECTQPFGFGQRISAIAHKKSVLSSSQRNTGKPKVSLNRDINTLLNFRKIKTVLENCILTCKNHGCNYSCFGENIKQFYAHVTDCKFAQIPCPNKKCRQSIQRGRTMRHHKKCRFKQIKCPNDGCKMEFTPRDFRKHRRICKYSNKICPNHKFGCKSFFKLKDTESHLKKCEYQMVDCDMCDENVIRIELEDHKTKRCFNGLVSCLHCNSKIKRGNLERHTQMCLQQEINVSNNTSTARQVHEKFFQPFPVCSLDKNNRSGPGSDLPLATNTCTNSYQTCENCGDSLAMKDENRHRKYCSQNQVFGYDEPRLSKSKTVHKTRHVDVAFASDTKASTNVPGYISELDETIKYSLTIDGTHKTDLTCVDADRPPRSRDFEDVDDSGFYSVVQRRLHEVTNNEQTSHRAPVNHSKEDISNPSSGSEIADDCMFRKVAPFNRQISNDKLGMISTAVESHEYHKWERKSHSVDAKRQKEVRKEKRNSDEQRESQGNSKLNFLQKLIKSRR